MKHKQKTKKTFRSPQKILTVEAEAFLESVLHSNRVGKWQASLASMVLTLQDQPNPFVLGFLRTHMYFLITRDAGKRISVSFLRNPLSYTYKMMLKIEASRCFAFP